MTDRSNLRPNFDDLAGELVPEDRAHLEAGRKTVIREEVSAADRRSANGHDRVARLENRRIRDLVDAELPRFVEHDRLHAGCSISTRYPSGSTQKKRHPPHGGSYGSARNSTPRAPSRACSARASATSTTSTTFCRDRSRGASSVTPGRSSAGWPCSASESRAPASVSVAYGGSSYSASTSKPIASR